MSKREISGGASGGMGVMSVSDAAYSGLDVDRGDVSILYPELTERLQTSLQSVSGIMARQMDPSDDIVVFLGSTRAGKSTLVNYLIGNSLICTRDPATRQYKIDTPFTSGPKIGTTTVSETVYPSKWSSEKFPSQVLWDAPGFGDNRGVIQDITNAFYVRELLTHVKTAKFALVVDISHITNANVQPFIDLLSAMGSILPNINTCKTSVSIIFTKVPTQIDDEPVDRGYIAQLLKVNIVDSGVLSRDPSLIRLTELVSHFIEDKEHIGIFKKSKEGEIDPASIDDGIMKAINNATSLDHGTLSEVSASLSKDSKLFLFKARDILCKIESFDALFKDITESYLEELKSLSEEISEGKVDHTVIQQMKGELKAIEEKIKDVHDSKGSLTLTEMLKKIAKFDGASLDLVNKIISDAKLIQFIDDQLDGETSHIFVTKIDNAIMQIKSEIDRINIQIEQRLHTMTEEEAKRAQEERIKEKKEQDEKYARDMQEHLERVKAENEKIKLELERNKAKLEKDLAEQEKRAIQEKEEREKLTAEMKVQSELREAQEKKAQEEREKFTAEIKAKSEAAEKVAEEMKKSTEKLEKDLAAEKAKPKGSSCVVSYVTDIDYDNPLLNKPHLVDSFNKFHSIDAFLRLIDITSELAKDSREELEEALNGDYALEICADLIGECSAPV